jgi:hypothetical protein
VAYHAGSFALGTFEHEGLELGGYQWDALGPFGQGVPGSLLSQPKQRSAPDKPARQSQKEINDEEDLPADI